MGGINFYDNLQSRQASQTINVLQSPQISVMNAERCRPGNAMSLESLHYLNQTSKHAMIHHHPTFYRVS
jgi:uncharacterized membrane protein